MEDFRMEVERLYDMYLQDTENRGVSYGELAYLQTLDEVELQALYDELVEGGYE